MSGLPPHPPKSPPAWIIEAGPPSFKQALSGKPVTDDLSPRMKEPMRGQRPSDDVGQKRQLTEAIPITAALCS